MGRPRKVTNEVHPEASKEDNILMYTVFSASAIDKMGGNRGKLATMAGHAFLHAWWDALNKTPELCNEYQNSEKAYKVVLKVADLSDLEMVYESLSKQNVGLTKVVDAGITVFGKPTYVGIGVGPIRKSDTGILKNLGVLI